MFHRIRPLYVILCAPLQVPLLCDYKFNHGSAMIPHPKKLKTGGEDAFFAKKHALGVVDGVSSWKAEEDIDAGDFLHIVFANTPKEQLVTPKTTNL
jgi:hypothetical protein